MLLNSCCFYWRFWTAVFFVLWLRWIEFSMLFCGRLFLDRRLNEWMDKFEAVFLLLVLFGVQNCVVSLFAVSSGYFFNTVLSCLAFLWEKLRILFLKKLSEIKKIIKIFKLKYC